MGAGWSDATDLVGRSGERRQIAAAVTAAAEGRGGLLVLTGDPGAGKTALAQVAAGQAGAVGGTVLWAAAHEAPDAPPYLLWTRLLRAALPTAPPGWPGDPRPLAALLPELLAEGTAEPPAPPHGPARFALFDEVRRALAALRARDPLLLVLDDLHAADPASLELLQLLVQELRSMPLLVVAAYRPHSAKRRPAVDRVLATIAKEGRQLPLAGLGAADVHHLVERTRRTATCRKVARRLHERSGGNPALVLALARGLAATDPGEAVEDLPIGADLRAAARQHLDQLDERGAALLAPAAVLGPDIDLGRLQALVGLAGDELLRELAECVSSGVLAEHRREPGRYRFRFEAVREVVYAEVPTPERAALHLRAAAAIERTHARDLEPHLAELARHYLSAAPEDAARALPVTVRAARRAEQLLELDRAAGLWRGALDLAERGGTDRLERCDLLQSYGDALRRIGEDEPARVAFLEAAHVARAAGDDARLARAALACGGRTSTPTAGVMDRPLVDLLTDALARCDDPAVGAALLGRLALERYHVDPHDVRDARTREAVAMAERSGDPAAMAQALHARHFALWDPDDVDERARNAADVLAIADEAGDAALAMQAHTWCVVARLEQGDMAAVDRHIAAHSRLVEASDDPYHRWLALVFRGMRALVQGRFDAAERHAQSAFELGVRREEPGPPAGVEPNARMVRGIQLFNILRDRGRLAELDESVAVFARSFPQLPVWQASLALVRLNQGRTAEARELLDRLAAGGFANLPVDGTWFVATTVLAEVVVRLGDTRLAEELHQLLLPYERRVVVVADGAACRGPVAYHLGLLRATTGQHDEAVAHLRRALEIDERLGARPHAARARVALARSLHAAGGDRAAVEPFLRTALSAAVDMGLAEVAQQAELGLAELGSTVGSAGAVPAASRAAARLELDGSRWTVAFEGRVAHLRDAKGLRYLALLLAEPGVDRPASLLERLVTSGGDRTTGARDRFSALQEALAIARAEGDDAAALRARRGMARLAEELTGDADGRAEQARVNVTRAIRTALRNIARADAGLAAHLEAAIRTGTACTYRPDPRAPITWEVRTDAQVAS